MRKLSGKEKARYVDAMFAHIVPRYDLMNRLMTFGQDVGWRKETVRLAAIPPGGQAIDLASGTGDLAIALATAQTQARVCAVDFCAPMLEEAARKAGARGLSRLIKFVVADAMALPFPEGSFDGATMGFALRNVADIPRTLEEIHRVLRPGGRFANLELTPVPPGLTAGLFQRYFHRVVPLLGGLITGDRDAYTYLPDSVTSFPPAGDLAAMFRAAGFAAVSYRRLAAGTVAVHLGIKR
jgi:demethylmenaquinone methyltransferase/2-methoxy-6-polyprenyl-1,4-benzoquinol methylase